MEDVLQFIQENAGIWGLAAVFVAAALEYLLPPLPADTVVLSGPSLVVAGAWSFASVATAAVLGGLLGALIHFELGRSIPRKDGQVRGQKYLNRIAGEGALERFFEAFRKHGMWVIAFNRAFPGVRAVTFIAAGCAGLPRGKTMAYGLISNVAWTLALLGLGVSVGANWEKIQAVFAVYKTAVYSLGGIGLTVFVVYKILRRRRPRGEE